MHFVGEGVAHAVNQNEMIAGGNHLLKNPLRSATPPRGRSCCALQHPKGKVLFVILSDGKAGVEGSVNILKRENGFFDFAAYGRFAQNDTMGKVLLRAE